MTFFLVRTSSQCPRRSLPLCSRQTETTNHSLAQGASMENRRKDQADRTSNNVDYTDAQFQMNSISSGATPINIGRTSTSVLSNLLSSHMPRTILRSTITSSRIPLARQAKHTVTFSDDHVGAILTTPKEDSLRSGFSKLVDMERQIKGAEPQRNRLMGSLGSRGSGVAPKLEHNTSELARGKVSSKVAMINAVTDDDRRLACFHP